MNQTSQKLVDNSILKKNINWALQIYDNLVF